MKSKLQIEAEQILLRQESPAYPIFSPTDIAFKGLTKLEHFAGLAMQGLLANTKFLEYVCHKTETAEQEVSVLNIASIDYAKDLLKQLEAE